MEREELIRNLHEIAGECAAAAGRVIVVEPVSNDDANLLAQYGFSSLDALEYLLVVEERFGVTFEDEDLNEEILSSAGTLAEYILKNVGD